jgi:dephospho-CoA kinase
MRSSLSPLRIGVTGGIGSGKSTVCKIIESLGYPVFYSDVEGKKALYSNQSVIHKVIALFGPDAYINGVLNTGLISEQVFKNKALLNELNSVIHPVVRSAFEEFAMKENSKRLVFNEAAILFETGAYKNFDFNILVVSPKPVRIQRIIARDQISEKQIIERMGNQWEDTQKIPLADFIIKNSDNADLEDQIRHILKELESKK